MGKRFWRAGNLLNPLPVVMVSVEYEGIKNIITVAWCGTVCSDPAMLSISIRKERYSYNLIDKSNEFVVNLATKDLCFATDYCGVTSGKNVDKFEHLGLHAIQSKYVKAPSILESPVNIECKVVNKLDLGSHTMFVAEILGVTVDEKYFDENDRFMLEKAKLVSYSHGKYYELGDALGKFGYSIEKKKK